MPFNGSGVYTPPAADFPVVTLTVISSTHFNNTINDIATALSSTLTKDGQNTMTANLPGGGFRITNIGITGIAGSVGTPALNVSDGATGLYRSAANELAVTVNGTQRSRWDSTGLIVTGVATVSGILTGSTSVVTPIVDSGSGTLILKGAGTTALTITGANAVFAGTLTATTSTISPILDSGSGSLVLKGAGTTALTITAANAVFSGTLAVTTAVGKIIPGATSLSLRNNADSADNLLISDAGVITTRATSLTLGASPTIAVVSGSLTITPNLLMSARLQMTKGADLSAGGSVTLGSGNLFILNGGAPTINLLDNTGWQSGSVVMLVCASGAMVIKNNQAPSTTFRAMFLQGGADFSMAPNNTLSLVFDSGNNQWYEIGRKT